MWYNDILLVLMGVIAIVLILMAVMVGSRVKRPPKIVEEEEPKSEKILVERGFENHKQEEPTEPEPEPEPDYSAYMPSEPPEYEEPPIEEPIEPEPDYSEYIEPEHEEPPIEETVELEPTQEEPKPIPDEPVFEEPPPDESVEITPIEPIFMETDYQPESEQPDIYGSPSIDEPNDDVIITPNQTFYDPIIEEPSVEPEPIEEPPETSEPEPLDVTEIEPPVIETEPHIQALEETEPDTEEEPEELTPPEETLETRSRTRIRKPIIDESDPEINVDLGVETCPHCGSKVPNTIYCINCGKALDPNNIPEPEEE